MGGARGGTRGCLAPGCRRPQAADGRGATGPNALGARGAGDAAAALDRTSHVPTTSQAGPRPPAPWRPWRATCKLQTAHAVLLDSVSSCERDSRCQTWDHPHQRETRTTPPPHLLASCYQLACCRRMIRSVIVSHRRVDNMNFIQLLVHATQSTGAEPFAVSVLRHQPPRTSHGARTPAPPHDLAPKGSCKQLKPQRRTSPVRCASRRVGATGQHVYVLSAAI